MMSDIDKLLGTLGDPEKELFWDECWDRLMDAGDNSQQSIHSLFKALEGQTAMVRIAAIRKLRELGINGALWTSQLCGLLTDDDHEVRLEAFEAAKPLLNTSPEIIAAVKTMSENNAEYLGLRIKAWWFLWRSRSAKST